MYLKRPLFSAYTSNIFFAAIDVYLVLCILSYYQELKEKRASGAVQHGANEDGKERSLA